MSSISRSHCDTSLVVRDKSSADDTGILLGSSHLCFQVAVSACSFVCHAFASTCAGASCHARLHVWHILLAGQIMARSIEALDLIDFARRSSVFSVA